MGQTELLAIEKDIQLNKKIMGSRNILIFLEVKNRMVGPLSKDTNLESGFFVD
jgi:hypothetical protein